MGIRLSSDKVRVAVFVQPSEVPKDFAMSFHRVMHNQADHSDWELIDSYTRMEAMQWIQMLLRANGVDNFEKELVWWNNQLFSKESKEN